MTDHSPDHAERAKRKLPMQENEVIALAERCEGKLNAVEVVRLNGDILRGLGWTSDDHHVYDPDGNRRSGVPDYTGSMDAAMMLVPDSVVGWRMDWSGTRAVVRMGFGGIPETIEAWCVTPALALCSAALRARSAIRAATLSKEGE